ncbi:MAG: hypothetical protein V3V05_09310 [Pontiella sp.]
MKALRFLCLFAAIPLLNGCSKDAVETSALSAPVLSRQYRNESVTVILSISETNVPTSGKIQLMIDVHAPPVDEVIFPEVVNFIEPFVIANGYTEPLQILPNGKRLHRRVWRLLPNLPGETIFQSLEIKAGSTTITTEQVHVFVSSLLPVNIGPLEIKDIVAPVSLLPQQQKKRRWMLNIALGLAGSIVVLLVHRYRKKERNPMVALSHETALRSMRNLPADEIEKIHLLIEILLAFVEDRFLISTRGKTTREILSLLMNRWPPLNEYLIAGEHIRFSHKAPAGFTADLENFVRSFIEDNQEVPCD